MVLVFQTDITLMAILLGAFAKIAQELARTADVIRCRITYHALDALLKLLLSLLVCLRRDDDLLAIYSITQIGDIRYLTARNELDDMSGSQILQGEIHLLDAHAGMVGYQRFVDIHEVGEETAIDAQQGGDDLILVACKFSN